MDTDVISFIFKDHPLSPADTAILAGRSLAVSRVTLAEIEYGMEAKNWGTRRRIPMYRFLSRFKPLLPGRPASVQCWTPTGRTPEQAPIAGLTRVFKCQGQIERIEIWPPFKPSGGFGSAFSYGEEPATNQRADYSGRFRRPRLLILATGGVQEFELKLLSEETTCGVWGEGIPCGRER